MKIDRRDMMKDKMISRNVKMPNWLWQEIEKASKKTSQTKSAIVRMAIIEKLQKIERI
jgi:predicted DNA-binding protein